MIQPYTLSHWPCRSVALLLAVALPTPTPRILPPAPAHAVPFLCVSVSTPGAGTGFLAHTGSYAEARTWPGPSRVPAFSLQYWVTHTLPFSPPSNHARRNPCSPLPRTDSRSTHTTPLLSVLSPTFCVRPFGSRSCVSSAQTCRRRLHPVPNPVGAWLAWYWGWSGACD